MFLLVLEAQGEPQVDQERVKIGPRWPSWSQDGPKMAKDEPTWADIGTQHCLRLRITAPVQQIRPSKGGGLVVVSKLSGGALERVYTNKE